MEIRIDRAWKRKGYTISRLYVNGIRFGCNALEDEDRGLRQTDTLASIMERKVKDKTAIPSGRYRVKVSYSGTFEMQLPILLNVPGYEGVRIHSGNTANDTKGCILIGKNDKVGWISNSRYWTAKLQKEIEDAISRKEPVYITIDG